MVQDHGLVVGTVGNQNRRALYTSNNRFFARRLRPSQKLVIDKQRGLPRSFASEQKISGKSPPHSQPLILNPTEAPYLKRKAMDSCNSTEVQLSDNAPPAGLPGQCAWSCFGFVLNVTPT